MKFLLHCYSTSKQSQLLARMLIPIYERSPIAILMQGYGVSRFLTISSLPSLLLWRFRRRSFVHGRTNFHLDGIKNRRIYMSQDNNKCQYWKTNAVSTKEHSIFHFSPVFGEFRLFVRLFFFPSVDDAFGITAICSLALRLVRVCLPFFCGGFMAASM
jgi:hypothetical protein